MPGDVETHDGVAGMELGAVSAGGLTPQRGSCHLEAAKDIAVGAVRRSHGCPPVLAAKKSVVLCEHFPRGPQSCGLSCSSSPTMGRGTGKPLTPLQPYRTAGRIWTGKMLLPARLEPA